MRDVERRFRLGVDVRQFWGREQIGFAEGDGAEVLHGAGLEVGNADEVKLLERVVNAEVVVVVVQRKFGDVERKGRERNLVGRGADANVHAVLLAAGALEVAHQERDEIGGHFGRGAKDQACACPAPGPGVSVAIGVFEMAVSPASMVSEMSKVALKAGSSKQGKARRASVASNCVTA